LILISSILVVIAMNDITAANATQYSDGPKTDGNNNSTDFN